MTLTRDDLLFANEFHEDFLPCNGPRSNRWRRNGKTREWKRDPDRLEVPVKFGMRTYGVITLSTPGVHTAEKCPYLQLSEMLNKEPITSTPPATLGA